MGKRSPGVSPPRGCSCGNSILGRQDFLDITSLPTETSDLFLVTPNQPAPGGGGILANFDYVDLNTINVTDYTEYDTKDAETLAAFHAVGDPSLGRSVETPPSDCPQRSRLIPSARCESVI